MSTRLAASTLRYQVSSGASLSLLQASTLESFLPYCIFHLNWRFKSANYNISQLLLLTLLKICLGVSANPFKREGNVLFEPVLFRSLSRLKNLNSSWNFVAKHAFLKTVFRICVLFIYLKVDLIFSRRTLLNVRPYRPVCQRQIKNCWFSK